MEKVRLGDKQFKPLLAQEKIQKRVDELASELLGRMEGSANVTFVCILKGSLVFTADLIRAYGASSYVEFVRCRSYIGLTSNRSPQIDYTSFSTTSLEGHHVVILEDIVETGHTLALVQDFVRSKNPESLTTISLLRKPQAAEQEVEVDLVGFEIGDDFVVGYGLDYNGEGRNLKSVYVLDETDG